MNSETDEFSRCVGLFSAHDYDNAANCAINCFFQRSFLCVAQIMLISLERCGNWNALKAIKQAAYESFEKHPHGIQLLKVTTGEVSAVAMRESMPDARSLYQLHYYEAARLLTEGDPLSARESLAAMEPFEINIPENQMRLDELENPEPPRLTAGRLLTRLRHLIEADDPALLSTALSNCVAMANHSNYFDQVSRDIFLKMFVIEVENLELSTLAENVRNDVATLVSPS